MFGGAASEISSQAGDGDFEDNLLVSTPNQQVEQVLVVQAQNGVNMASGTATTAPNTATTAPSTAPLQVAGPSTMEPIVPIGVQLGQDFAGGSREGLERVRQTQCFSRIIHLAKLNTNCHMNYLDYL